VAERLSYLRKVAKSPSDLQRQLVESIEATISSHEQKAKISVHDWKFAKTCPKCSSGTLMQRRTNSNPPRIFMGCSKYPDCNHTEEVPVTGKKG
jgi:ssDNA-binding Zn-finger/Zn-ribbon topoisomerase 1